MKITDKILSAWIDESLNPKKMRAVDGAVQSDPELQTRADALRAVGAALREESFDLPVAAERMVSDVQREIRLQDSPPPQSFWPPLWVRTGAAVCACLVIVALWIPAIKGKGAWVAQTEIKSVDSGLSGASTMVYTDHDAGWIIVWLDGVELEPGS